MQHDGTVVTVASVAARFLVHLQDQDLSVWSLPVFSPHSKDMHIRLTGECKLGCVSCDREYTYL